jgi:hypothetical protein
VCRLVSMMAIQVNRLEKKESMMEMERVECMMGIQENSLEQKQSRKARSWHKCPVNLRPCLGLKCPNAPVSEILI